MDRTRYYQKVKRLDKLSQKDKLDLAFDLINSFRIVKSPVDSALFLQDLLTASEIRNLSIRLRIAKLLLNGKTYREITENLHCSFGTVAKVSIWLNRSGEGFRSVISKLPERYKFPKDLPRGPIEFHLPQVLLALGQHALTKGELKRLANFTEGVENKRALDEEIRAFYKHYYSHKQKVK